MVRSMTAFERRERQGEWGRISWELRSINHRYLDIYPRLPEELRTLEPALRERVGRKLARGKVECSLRYRPAVGVSADVQLNWSYAEQLLAACEALSEKASGAAPVSPVELLRFPGVLKEPEADLEPVVQAALALLDETLDGFIANREREGERLGELIAERAQRIAELVVEVRGRRVEVNARVREKLLAKLGELDTQADSARFEQELIYLLQRLDVDEELDRLETHVAELRRALARREPIGRRLDFLMQELNRESNTLGSKSADTETTQAAVEMKVLIEQMREQIQNIE
ncbi:YicC/YloC family endoribonuclease [Alkalilimnicola sp. S0819]|uniref:YicC/YloC family endoribonuclease n=1 Tax=Alkalilimnicola sp. S0819 TaxID=2613922 RepID=UPI0012625285|nr:YicC/YloC family endoribonuclease [Alkalilimnicola sp. S0819]KAB7624421.1 YicC family protein [Alkalilimnicola sp. S0819]MPQ16252.1 YicC family protein [Alkalilimnicola sp. S0819]